MLDRHGFVTKLWFVLFKSKFWVNVKLYSEKGRVNGKTTQNELHYRDTAWLFYDLIYLLTPRTTLLMGQTAEQIALWRKFWILRCWWT